MKKTNKLISLFLVAIMLIAFAPSVAYAADTETVILYTNDVHCAVDDYPVLAAYKADLIAQGKNVVVVDAGDAIQGEVIGAMTQGEAIVDIMNAVGYDYAVPGNHEFDYGMDAFLDLAQNKAEYEYISSNFHDLRSNSPVISPYAIEDFGAYQVAFVGISTPETITKSTPEYFKDKNGNFIYGFPTYPEGMTNEALYENIQKSVDKAVNNGADVVVAVGHTGVLETTDGWKSTDIIANTNGIDYYIDAHSHETIESATYKNIENEDVILTSTGTKFANFGVLTISGDTASFELVNPDEVNVKDMSIQAQSAYDSVKAKVDGYKEEIAYLYEKNGTSEAKLVAYDSDGSWAVRKRETNAGDFVTDAYRAVTGADVAIANGGGIRADIEIGDISRKNLMDVNAFNNDMCVVEVTGQQLIDVLEHGARECPDPIGGFFQVSGVEFEIHTYRETPVICDQLDNFIEMDETKERRVQNVLVGGEPIELDKTYTLAGSAYVLTKGGDGLTMLDGAKVLQQEGLPCDSEMLIKYFTETLGGKITAEKYGNPDGNGRIEIIDEAPDVPDYDYEIGYGDTVAVTVETNSSVYVKFVPEKTAKYIFRTESDWADTGACMFDSNGEEVLAEYWDDTEESYDFILKCKLEAGKAYYLNIYVHHGDGADFDLVVECGHSYENGVCAVCGEACDHELTEDRPYICECGQNFTGKDISAGVEVEHDWTGREGNWECYRFVPEESGVYYIESFSNTEESDPYCFVLNADGDYVASGDDYNGTLDFRLVCAFESGKTYYLEIGDYYENSAFAFKLERMTHTDEDGSIHDDFILIEETYSNCTEHGYSEGVYCNECEEFIYGHEEYPLDEGYHPDENWDDICDLCGKENIWAEEECEHICHSDHWFWSIVWRIANFFHRIFGVLPECECGEAHYFYIDFDV